MPPSDPPLLWTPFGRTPTILTHHLPNHCNRTECSGPSFSITCFPMKSGCRFNISEMPNSCGSKAINAPPNPLLRRTSLGSGHTTCSQVHPSPFDTQTVLGSHARYHLIHGGFWVLLPYGSHSSFAPRYLLGSRWVIQSKDDAPSSAIGARSSAYPLEIQGVAR